MDKQIVIGKIIAPHGVRGEFRLMPLTENPDRYLEMKKLLLENGKEFTIISARFHKNMVLIKTEEITSMDEVELLRGQNVVVNTKDLPPLEQGRFYVADLIGFAVVTLENEDVGKLSDVITTGSNDVFVVKSTSGKEIMIPAIDTHIKEIDTKSRTIKVVLPQWID
ncbi:Ribosome maturation factor RimM [bioreactor metagenome]|uniref:Ribosome maturation factor RimM n=1 Tax=bioreactor metagenome TaxID=1076179 RepID=A0A644VJV7_9ZZZZ|nr:ribosome maturation factor RimM [Acidaminococcaceae bacterium]NLU44484.1 16S rRNA processing protein RimM [Acholeplasmataceae bacterium]